MAKKDDSKTVDFFGIDAAIIGLGVADIKIKESNIYATLTGTVTTNDAAQLDSIVWGAAIAEWLVFLSGNNGEVIDGFINHARMKYHEREQDFEFNKSGDSKIASFPSGAHGALA